MYVAQKTSFSATSVTFSLSGSFCAPPRNRGTEPRKKSTQAVQERQESKKHEDLITVCDNVLTLHEVWGPSSSFDTSSSGCKMAGGGGLSPEDLAKKGMLRFVASVTLAASPTGVSKIRVGSSTSLYHDTPAAKSNSNSSSSSSSVLLAPYPDQIVLTFDHEHLSIIAFDAYTCTFVTNALFRLGEQSIVREDVGVPSLLAVDPSNRCIAMLLRRRYLALIPVEPAVPLSSNIGVEQKTTVATGSNNSEKKQKKVVDNWGDDEDDDEEGQNDDVPETAKAEETHHVKQEEQRGDGEDDVAATLVPNPNLRPVHTLFGQPKYLDLYSLPERVRNVRDMAFVPSHSGEPTIGFLCEKEPTWAGRAKLIDVAAASSSAVMIKKDPSSVNVGGNMDPAAFANSPSLQTHQAMTSLVPFNATRLIPCALPNCDAGFLVLAANSVLHLTRTRAAGFYLNDFGKEEATCSTNTKIHWSPLERVSTAVNKNSTADNTRIMAETNLTFSDAVATMVGACRAIVACPLSGLICALDMSVSGRNVTGVVCIPITSGAIASTVAVVSTPSTASLPSSSSPSLSDSTPMLSPPIVSFFLGSAVGDSIIYSAYSHPQHRRVISNGNGYDHEDTTSDSNTDVIIVPPRVFPWIKSIIRNIGPIVDTDIGDFTTPEVGETTNKKEEQQQQDERDKKEKTDDPNNEEEKKEGDDDATPTNANPYEYLLNQTVTPDGPQPFVPLYDVLAASDLVAVGGEGEYGHISFARQSIRPLEVLSQPGDCIAVFVSNPNQSRAEAESEGDNNNTAAKKRARSRTAGDNHDDENNDDNEETKRRLDDNHQEDGEEESADSKTITTTSQVLFISYPSTTSVFELSESVKRLRREEEKEKKEIGDVDGTAAADDGSGNPQTGNEQKKENGAKNSPNQDDDEDDECPWRTDLRTVWAGAVACRSKASVSSSSSSSLSLTTRMIQVTEKTVVIVEDFPFSKKKKRPVRRLVAEIELISSSAKSDNANDESVNEEGAIDTNEISPSSASASSSLRHAFMIANTNLMCATSTAGITYLVDVLNPSVQILNEHLASFLIQEAHVKIIKLTEEQQSNRSGIVGIDSEEAFASLRQQQQEIIDSIAVNGGNVKISSVCDAADAGFGGNSSSHDGFIFVSEANSGSLSIIRVTSSATVEEEGENMGFSCVAVIPTFASLPQAVLNGQPRESDLDVKKPRNTSARSGGPRGGKAGNTKNNGVIEVTEMLCSSMRSSSSSDEKALFLSSSSVSASTFAFFYALSACGEVAVYKVRASDKSFFKIDQKFVDREFFEEKLESLEEKKKKLNLAEGVQTVQDTTANTKALTQRLVKFSDLTGLLSFSGTRSTAAPLSGVFVCGRRSSVFLSRGGRLVHHHIQTAGPLRGFTEIHAKAISQARFILAGEGFVSYCRLERRVNYLEDWCMRREVIRKTPHFVGYLGPYRSCLVVTSERVPFRPIRAPFDINVEVTVNGEGQPSEFKVAPRVLQPFIQSESGSVPIPTTDQYSVTLYNAVPFTKLDSITLEENEQVLTSCVGTLYPEHNGLPITDSSGLPHALTVFAVGTAFPLGEDITCRGRLLLIKPSRSTTTTGNSGTTEANNDNTNNNGTSSATKKFIQVIHREECKGPVTALTFVRSYLAAAVAGTIKIFSYDSKAEQLVTVSFLGAGNFIPKMVAFKDFVLFGDLFNSVTLGKIHSVDKTAYVLAKHAKEFEVSTVDICYKGKELGIIVGGATGHSLLLSYQPQRDGDGNVVGGKLVEEAGAKLSAGIATSTRLRIPKNSNKAEFSDETLILYTTAGGEIGCFHPISERISRILAAVNRTMCVAVPQPAGLDPSLFKAIPTEDYSNGIFTSNLMIDGDGVTNFMLLSFSDRAALAAAAKVSQDRVLNALCGLSEQSFLIL